MLLSIGIHAQKLFDQQNRFTIQSGIDPATMITFRYERNLDKMVFDKSLYASFELSSSMTRFGLENSETKMGVRIPLFNFGKFMFIPGLNTSYGRAETINFNSQKVGLEGDFAFGYYGSRGFGALTTSYEKILATRLQHTPYYRDRFYNDAIDGWYTGNGGIWQFGMEGGFVIKNKIDVYIEIKVPLTENFKPMMGSPGHVNVGLGYRF